MGKLSLDDLLDVNSFDDLNKLNKAISGLSRSFKKAVNTLEEQSDSFEESIEKNIVTLKKYGKTIHTLAGNQLSELNTQVEKLIINNKQLKSQIEVVTKEKKKLKDADEELSKIQKRALEIQQKQKRITQQELKNDQEKEKLKQQQIRTAEAERKQKERIKKEVEKLNSAYAQESKRLNELRKKYKDLIISEGKSTKETRKLKREIDKLDKSLKDVDAEVGQFQRNVGNYPQTLGKASQALIKFAGAAATVGASGSGLRTALGATEEGSKDVAEAAGTIESAFDIVKEKTADIFLDTKDLLKGLFSDDAIPGRGGGGGFFSRTTEDADDLADKFGELDSALSKFRSSAIDLEKEYRTLQSETENLNQESQKQLAIAGDSTRSFDEIAKANQEAIRIETKKTELLIAFAEKEKKLIDDVVEAKTKAGVKDNALLDLQTEKEVNLINLRGELATQQIEINKAISENDRDRFERSLDFAIDAFDAEKTVRERQISDESKTLKDRESILKETEELANKSFENQIKLAEDYVGRKLNLDELVKESDEEVIRARLGIGNKKEDDVVLGRILEIIRERKFVTQDLADAERDLADARITEEQAKQNISNQEKEIKLLNEKIKAIKEGSNLEDVTIESRKNEIDTIESEIKLLEDQEKRFIHNSEKQLEIRQEINEKTIELLEKRIEQEEAIKNKADNEEIKRLQKQEDRKNAVLRGVSEVVDDKIENEIASAAIVTYLNSLQAGKTVEEAQADALNAVATASIIKGFSGFHDGGYTGDGNEYQVAGLVHRGENVNTAEQVDRYGMKGWSAKDFDNAIRYGYFDQFKEIDSDFNKAVSFIQPQVINEASNIDYDKIGKKVGENMPDYSLFVNNIGHLVSRYKQGNKEKRTIHKDPKKPIIG